MNPILAFANQLSTVIPNEFSASEKLTTMFNILLVKFGLRPSTLIDNITIVNLDVLIELNPGLIIQGPTAENLGGLWFHNELQLKPDRFVTFIKQDPDLMIDILVTEGSDELWIYNKRFSDLFEDKDISEYDERLIHSIRGSRLGYPCSEYFFDAYDQLSLLVTMYLNDIKCYSYVCPPNHENSYQSVDLWLKFKPFADALDYKFTLNLEMGVL